MQRILIVDNEPAILRALARTCRGAAVVETAINAADALTILLDRRFDVVFTDYEMPPGETGIWLLREVRVRFPSIRRLLMSGMARDTFEPELVSGLIQGFLAKPFTTAEVCELLA